MFEKRVYRSELCRAKDEGEKGIVGYAAVFFRDDDPGTEYELDDGSYDGVRLVERIDKKAFEGGALRNEDVIACFNHNEDHILGRSGAGTLKLEVDDVGLRYVIDPPDTQLARDLKESMSRGDITGSSFAFRVESSTLSDEDKKTTVRTITKIAELRDVGPVTFPAYTATTATTRDAAFKEYDGWKAHKAKLAEEAEMELRAFRNRLAVARARRVERECISSDPSPERVEGDTG